MPTTALGDLPLHIADLGFLAGYRQHRERVIAGRGAAIVKRDLEGLRADLLRAFGKKADLHHRGYAAMQDHILGDWEAAREAFSGLRNRGFIEPFEGISSIFMPKDLQAASRPDLAAYEVFPAAADHVALISLDQRYFEKYGLLAARMFAQSNPGLGLHFHAIGFDPRPVMASWDLPIALGVTLDHRDLSQFSSAQARGYYANARLLYTADYLRIYPHLFVVDVDGGVIRSLLDLAEEARNADLLLTSGLFAPGRELTRLPWEAVVACATYFSGSAGSHRFAESLGRYLHHAIECVESSGQRLWYSDQTALFYTWYDLRDSLRCVKFSTPAFKQNGGWKLFTGSEERLRFMRQATGEGANA